MKRNANEMTTTTAAAFRPDKVQKAENKKEAWRHDDGAEDDNAWWCAMQSDMKAHFAGVYAESAATTTTTTIHS